MCASKSRAMAATSSAVAANGNAISRTETSQGRADRMFVRPRIAPLPGAIGHTWPVRLVVIAYSLALSPGFSRWPGQCKSDQHVAALCSPEAIKLTCATDRVVDRRRPAVMARNLLRIERNILSAFRDAPPCPTKTPSAKRNATSARAKPRAHRPENSSARRFTTFAKASTARDRPDKRSRSGCPRHDAQAWTCRRPRRARYPKRHARARRGPTSEVTERRRLASRRRSGSGPLSAHSGASHVPRRPIGRSRGRRILQLPDGRGRNARRRRGRRRAPSAAGDRPRAAPRAARTARTSSRSSGGRSLCRSRRPHFPSHARSCDSCHSTRTIR